ncbi:unannotated protein [freshwater metagenome]|jgi:hypothetical protein|uniref:Unannotated protein n=1 Tax=freshwater metagenome TaxID=449393 RepID=A0A6J7RHH2_9ZZZZ
MKNSAAPVLAGYGIFYLGIYRAGVDFGVTRSFEFCSKE